MKTRIIALMIALVGTAAAESPARLAEAQYRAGIAAEEAGDPDSARSAYTEALRHNPNHANARFRLGELKIHGPKIAAKGREAKVGAVMLPEVAFQEASLSEALEALANKIEKQSEGKLVPNFVIQDPQGKLKNSRIDLRLKNIPVRGALQHVLSQAGARARYDEHAVVVTPL